MAKSKQGGAFGYLRGKVGALSYSVMSGSKSSSGKTEQVVRPVPEKVNNPQSVSQCLQRMKLGPAQKFYKAFSELIDNAFQGVEYGDKSRQYFLSKAMKAEGPYIQKGVDRFIPAAYLFSEGSLPSVGLLPFAAGATVITLEETTEEATVTPSVLAEALSVSLDTQITIAVVNNVKGMFVPSYISFADRLFIQDLPAESLGKDADGHITIDPSALGLDTSALVAYCVVVSRQDVSGTWLRSTQEMILNDEMRNELYGTTAMEAAIYSYQDTTGAANSINSEWYYNLGIAQAWPGKLVVGQWTMDGNIYHPVIGVQQRAGRVITSYFYSEVDDENRVIMVEDGEITTMAGVTKDTDPFDDLPDSVWKVWDPAYATQLGFMMGEE